MEESIWVVGKEIWTSYGAEEIYMLEKRHYKMRRHTKGKGETTSKRREKQKKK